MATAAAPTFAANPNEYILGFVRSPFVTAHSSAMTSPNQPNLLPIAYDQQYTGMSTNNTLDDIYGLSEEARGQCLTHGFSTVPIHLGAARLNDADPSLVFSSDGTRWTSPFYNMIAAMMATTIGGGILQLGDGTARKDGTIENSSGITNNATLVFNRFGNA